jgi:hypothetical protein
MFKLIGGFVVCGFALYGLVTFVEQQKTAVAIRKVNSSEASMATGPSEDAGAAHSNETAAREGSDAEQSVA